MLIAPTETAFTDRVDLVKRADRAARAYDSRIFQVQATYADNLRYVMVATSEGVLTARPPAAGAHERVGPGAAERRAAAAGPCRRRRPRRAGFLSQGEDPEHFAAEAAREAVVMLDAVEAPAGETTVVLGPGWPGILLHEAVGHGLEADFNRKGVSAFSGRIGQKVASELCTVIDDGTIRSRRGSLNVDDEGQPTQRNVLIENGVLRGYLQDKLSSRLLDTRSTGSGRRESYAHIPMPRMTNTFMLAGESDPQDIVRSVSKGHLLRQFRRRAGGYHQRQFCFFRFGKLPDRGRQTHPPGAQRHPHRQRSGSAQIRQHGGQRPAPRRRHRHLRQGRPERPRGRRHPDPQDRPHDGGRHGVDGRKIQKHGHR